MASGLRAKSWSLMTMTPDRHERGGDVEIAAL
jgi:hypothetical protein